MDAEERIKLQTRSLMAVCLVTWALQEVALDYLWGTIPSLGILLRTISSVGPVVSCGTAMLVLSGELTAGSLQRFTALAKRVCSIDLGQERNILSPVLLLELVQHFGHSMPSLFPRLKTIKLKSLNEMANAVLHFLAPVSTRSISIEAQVLPMDADPFVFPVFLKLGRMKSFKQLDLRGTPVVVLQILKVFNLAPMRSLHLQLTRHPTNLANVAANLVAAPKALDEFVVQGPQSEGGEIKLPWTGIETIPGLGSARIISLRLPYAPCQNADQHSQCVERLMIALSKNPNIHTLDLLYEPLATYFAANIGQRRSVPDAFAFLHILSQFGPPTLENVTATLAFVFSGSPEWNPQDPLLQFKFPHSNSIRVLTVQDKSAYGLDVDPIWIFGPLLGF
ncbi:hypothetical protein CC1G_09475 [Coprinopsis cinerea okayama7|uniref:Uncharacterized protein n=1 Tax=Coprinopsis cinerea (strain Okayama-7 / 130 / ATCC MYA-4618 / FGSC 9003) TaxID=240176 RepID=A8PDF9_COPC7|nr:hypothetical protein CC1G_09475 [Coprinopsis cinerea okayama7\|eukprot:XP_001840591.1 hypothetical protein CC1G_09475 [Coprinopsis cinerea okayama7\